MALLAKNHGLETLAFMLLPPSHNPPMLTQRRVGLFLDRGSSVRTGKRLTPPPESMQQCIALTSTRDGKVPLSFSRQKLLKSRAAASDPILTATTTAYTTDRISLQPTDCASHSNHIHTANCASLPQLSLHTANCASQFSLHTPIQPTYRKLAAHLNSAYTPQFSLHTANCASQFSLHTANCAPQSSLHTTDCTSPLQHIYPSRRYV